MVSKLFSYRYQNTVQLCFCFSSVLHNKKLLEFFLIFTKLGGY
jgi:hypothetical protein